MHLPVDRTKALGSSVLCFFRWGGLLLRNRTTDGYNGSTCRSSEKCDKQIDYRLSIITAWRLGLVLQAAAAAAAARRFNENIDCEKLANNLQICTSNFIFQRNSNYKLLFAVCLLTFIHRSSSLPVLFVKLCLTHILMLQSQFLA